VVWVCYITFEVLTVAVSYSVKNLSGLFITRYTLIVTLFYFHAGVVLKWGLKTKLRAIFLLPLAIAMEIVAFIAIGFGTDSILAKFHITPILGFKGFTAGSAFLAAYRCILYMVYSTGYYYLITFLQERKRAEELERQRLNEIILRQRVEQELTKAENAFLKAQINPHFLFNTLDFIYHNILEVSPLAADAVISLTEMMRYAIDADKGGEYILLGDEIDQVNNLQYLNRLRKKEELPLKLIYAEEVRELSFIPLVLLTLTENIFKHGNLSIGNEATMQIYIEKGQFVIETDNASSRLRKSKSSKTGLINIEKRLKYAYGDDIYFNHALSDDDRFRLQIKVPVRLMKETDVPLAV
jgi:two-component system, LytTR family, sensor kinase